jgi:3-oxoacyl-[acyl-carrier-protein] synthase II
MAADHRSPITMMDVVITGVGVRTPMGQSYREVREAFAAGLPLTRKLTGPGGRCRAGAVIAGGIRPDEFSRLDQMLMDPIVQLALAPAVAAWEHAGIAADGLASERLGVYLGTGQGTSGTQFDGFKKQAENGNVAPFTILRALNNGSANHIAIKLGLRGACETFMAGCASSATAIGEAFRAIRHGYLDAVVAGGVDAPFTEGAYRAWEAAGFLAPHDDAPVCRPFSRQRNGTLLGEGAVIYVLESADHARARGAHILARLAGYGASTDATRIGRPDASGRALAIERCLQDGHLATDQVGYISADACGDRLSDACEVHALRQVFGSRLSQVPMSATKSIHGHMVGASAAAGLLPALMALDEGLIAPTATIDEVDPEFADLSLDTECSHARLPLQAALVNSFALGGSNACMVLTRH